MWRVKQPHFPTGSRIHIITVADMRASNVHAMLDLTTILLMGQYCSFGNTARLIILLV